MTFGPQLSLCPSCGYFSLRVIESRHSKLAKRRRSQCDKCEHRVTTHEVTDEFFQKAKVDARIVEKLQLLVGGQGAATQACDCYTCKNNVNDTCAFDFPEFGTLEAADCNHYER
jgi:hypothetical protein